MKKVASALTKLAVVAVAALCVAACGKETMVEGGFSIGNGKQVKFAKGNLYYNKLTRSFGIYENQTECMGDVNAAIADTTYMGQIDLFGWGAVDNPLNISIKDSDYPSFTDWGSKVGGNWRTLNKDEWKFIMKGRTDARKKYALGRVNTTTGLILLPDLWTQPDSCPYFPGMNYLDSNVYNARMWQKMETAGAVFLPVTGYREGKSFKSAGSGRYWTSTEDFVNGAWGFAFQQLASAAVVCYEHRYPGFAVRLVQDVQ